MTVIPFRRPKEKHPAKVLRWTRQSSGSWAAWSYELRELIVVVTREQKGGLWFLRMSHPNLLWPVSDDGAWWMAFSTLTRAKVIAESKACGLLRRVKP